MESKATAAEPGASRKVRTLLERATAVRHTNPDEARALALEARVIARADGDPAGEAAALYRLATIAHVGGDTEDAFGLALDALDIAESCGAEQVRAWVTHLLGGINYEAANYAQALEYCMEALGIYESSPDTGGDEVASTLNTIALIYQSMGDLDRAIVTYERALAVAEPFGLWWMMAVVMGNIARIRSVRSEYLSAVSMGRQALDLARQHSPTIVTHLLADLGEAYMGLADPEQAAACFAEARRVLADQEATDSPPSPAAQLGVLLAEGRVALRRGALDEAIAVLRAALDLAATTDARDRELEINDLLAAAFKRSGRFEEALERRERHDELYRTIFTHTADLRMRTLQVAHATSNARAEAEMLRLRTKELEAIVGDGRALGPVPSEAAGAAHLEAFEQLAVLTEFRDAETGAHTNRVGDLAAEMAHALGKSPDWCELLRLAARLHDIGKVAVPDSVLFKTGPLTVEEYEMMKSHTSMGHRILAGNSAPLFQMAAEIAQSHHEWWDGSGYPLSLNGSSIALSGRIVSVADVYDALCSKRPYKRAWAKDEAARFVISGRNGQFDPDVIDAFVAVLSARDPELGEAIG